MDCIIITTLSPNTFCHCVIWFVSDTCMCNTHTDTCVRVHTDSHLHPVYTEYLLQFCWRLLLHRFEKLVLFKEVLLIRCSSLSSSFSFHNVCGFFVACVAPLLRFLLAIQFAFYIFMCVCVRLNVTICEIASRQQYDECCQSAGEYFYGNK